jgi:hypothetical protein
VAIIPAPEVKPQGIASVKVARNAGTPGMPVSSVASYVNMVAARRQRQLFQKHIGTTEFYAGAGPQTIWRTYIIPSPNMRKVRARIHYAPAPNTYLGTGTPYVRFAVGGVDQNRYYMNFTDGFTVAGFITDHRFMDAEITGLTPGTPAQIDIKVGNGARPFSISLYEVPRETLDEDDANQTAVDPARYAIGKPIHMDEWQDMNAAILSLWKHQATVFFSWCTPSGAAVTNATANATNVLDGAITGWAADAAGWKTPMYGRWRQFGTSTLGTDEFPVRLWCYGGTTAGNGDVIFKYTQGTIGTITVNGANAWYTLDATVRGIWEYDLVTVETQGSGANTVSIYAAGMMQWAT